MKKKFEWKKSKYLSIKLFGGMSFFSLVLVGSVYSFSGINVSDKMPFSTRNNFLKLSNQDKIAEKDASKSLASINLSEPSNNTNFLAPLTNSPIVTDQGDFVLSSFANNRPGLIKMNAFGFPVYQTEFANVGDVDFSNYKVRQVVQNYNQKNEYFVLVVSNEPNATYTESSSQLEVTNPGRVLQVVDNGVDNFVIKKTYELGGFVVPDNLKNFYNKIMFQAPLTPTDKVELSSSSLKVNNDANGNNGQKLSGTFNGSSNNLKVANALYLNSLNNLVYVGDGNNDNLYIFGGSTLANIWFYAFKLTKDSDDANNSSKVSAKLYGNYELKIHDGLVGARIPKEISSSGSNGVDANIVNAEKLKSLITNSDNMSFTGKGFPALQIIGAKALVNRNEIRLQVAVPNMLTGTSGSPVLIRSTNVNLAGAISDKNAMNNYPLVTPIVTGTMSLVQANTIIENEGNLANTIPLFSADLTANTSVTPYLDLDTYPENDGYTSNRYSNRYLGFDTQISSTGSTLSLQYTRSKITVYETNGTVTTKTTRSIPAAADSNTMFTRLQGVSYRNNSWYFVYSGSVTDGNESLSTVYVLTYDPISKNVQFVPTGISGTSSEKHITAIIPLSNETVYIASSDSKENPTTGHVQLYKRLPSGLFDLDNGFARAKKSSSGVPFYEVRNGEASSQTKSIWGNLVFQDDAYLVNSGFKRNPARQLADDDQRIIRTLVKSFEPAFAGQKFRVSAVATANNELKVSVAIQYFDGQFYSPEQLVDNQSSFNPLIRTYTGFSAYAPWVLPVAISVPILLAVIILGLGLGLGIPMYKARKIQDKGFVSTFKKVDTLTSAVGSVYKKIVLETSAVRKKPQLLKAGSKNPTPTGSKPTVPTAFNKPMPPKKPTPPSVNNQQKSPTPPNKPA